MTLARWRRTIRKDMAQMPAAIGAMHLGAGETHLIVGAGSNTALNWLIKTWPARATVKLRVRGIKLIGATRAGKSAAALFTIQWRAIGPFGPSLAKHVKF